MLFPETTPPPRQKFVRRERLRQRPFSQAKQAPPPPKAAIPKFRPCAPHFNKWTSNHCQ